MRFLIQGTLKKRETTQKPQITFTGLEHDTVVEKYLGSRKNIKDPKKHRNNTKIQNRKQKKHGWKGV